MSNVVINKYKILATFKTKKYNYFLQLRRKNVFSGEQLGLPEDFCTPLPAAVVELAGLDMRTTPLDRMTCIYDTVEQVSFFLLLWVC